MSTVSPDCARSDEVLLDYAYGELAEAPRSELEKHLPGCARCQAELAALRSTRRAMAALAPEPAPDAGLASLLAYAEQHAKRHARPARPRWMGWLLGAVPTAAALVIVATVALHMRSAPLSGPAAMQEEAPDAIPVAAAPEEGKRAALVPPSAVAKDQAPAEADREQLASGNVGMHAGASAERRAKLKKPSDDLGSAGRAAGGGFAAPERPVAAESEPLAKANKKKTAAVRHEDGRFGAARDDFAAPAAAAPPMSAGDADEKKEVMAQPAPAPARRSGSGSASRASANMQRVAAAPMAPPAPPPAAGPARTEVATAQVDELSQADQLRRTGQHQAAAAAYHAIYAADPHGPKAATALFSAALEEETAGQLAAAALDFESYARDFADSAQAPAALARAAQIRRSQAGEGAATALEQDLLRRYPNSPEASDARARLSRAAQPAKAERKAAPAVLDSNDVAPAAAPTNAPAEAR